MTPDDQELAARRAAVARMAATCPHCGRSLAGHGGTYAGSPEPLTGDASTYTIGQHVFVVADNYGSECTIIAYRDADGPMASHWQVRTESGDRFWALDYEISEVG